MAFQPVTVVKGDVIYTCSQSEEQLKRFLVAGYKVKDKEGKPKKTTKKEK